MPPSHPQARPPSALSSPPGFLPIFRDGLASCAHKFNEALPCATAGLHSPAEGRAGQGGADIFMPETPMIAYVDVVKSFDGGNGAERVLAVDDVSLEVAGGEFLAIVGGSGSGKTTLLRLANRLIDAAQGTITVEGCDVRKAD